MVSRGTVIAAFYVTDKEGAENFSGEDQRLIEMLSAHAAVAIENARLLERSRELSIVEERNRLARELHDGQPEAVRARARPPSRPARCSTRDPRGRAAQVTRLGELAQEALGELRGLIFELRPASLEDEGLAATLRKEVDMLQRVHGHAIELRIAGSPQCAPEQEGEVLRIAQEALNNALRHAEAERIELRMESRDGRLIVTVADDGIGFDPEDRALRARLGRPRWRSAPGLGGTWQWSPGPARAPR